MELQWLLLHPCALIMTRCLFVFLWCGAETDIFLASPFVAGGEMFDWVAGAPRPAREADVRPLFRQIVEAMQVYSVSYTHLTLPTIYSV